MEIKNIKIKAAAILAGIMLSTVLAILGIKLAFTYIPPNVLGIIGACLVLGFMLNLLFTIIVEQLKREETIKEMMKK